MKVLIQNRFTLVTPKSENDARLQATLDNQNPTGLPVGAVSYVSIGMLFAYKKIVFKYRYAVVGFSMSMLLLLLEVFVIKYYELYYARDYYIFLLPAVFFLFYLVTHFEVKQSKMTNQLRMYSMLIYFIHSWINFPIVSVINKMCEYVNGIEDYAIHSLLRFTIVISISIVLSKVMLYLSHKDKFYWVKKLY